jgi:predicted transcriptional regulator of viral defense system
MTVSARPKRSTVGVELVRLLAQSGDRIFTTARARELAPQVGLRDAYVGEALYHLRRNGWITSLRRGLYAMSYTVPGVAPVHEYEVAMALVQPAAVSHWSAFNHHGLTEQVPWKTFVLTTTEASVPARGTADGDDGDRGYQAGGMWYQFIQTRPERFFGVERIWVGEARVSITSLERTLLDGLAMPRYCGGFGEVVHAFGEATPRMDVDRMVVDALRLGAAVAKRLGWVLETQGIEGRHLEQLAALPVKGYRKLDASGPGKGRYNGRWMLQENLPGVSGT